MRWGLAARLALVMACLVAATSLLTTAAGVVSATGEINSDLDRFLRERADEIVSGQRIGTRDSDGRDGRRGRGQNNDNGNDDNGDDDDRANDDGGDVEAEIDDGALLSAVDADAIVQTLDENGEVISAVGGTLPVDRTDIELAESPGSTVIRTVSSGQVEYRLITIHIESGGAIQVARDLKGTNDLLGGIRNRMVIIGLVLSVLAAFAGWSLARSTTNPLRRLTESVEAVAETGDLSLSVGSERTDEIGRLADEFDRMLQALHVSQEQQRRLVQDAAHELRTPLTSIHANIEFLSRAPDLDSGARDELLVSVRSELHQLSALFTEIIELATDARDTQAHHELDLARVVEAAVRAFEARSATPVALQISPTTVMGDPAGLERAVANLLGNADKYGPEGESIVVTVADGTVQVTDRGPGIPAEERERVFDRFYRSDAARSQPGSGLGLAIVKKIVEDHGGRPWINDAPGGGTAAGFTLPVAHEPVPPPP